MKNRFVFQIIRKIILAILFVMEIPTYVPNMGTLSQTMPRENEKNGKIVFATFLCRVLAHGKGCFPCVFLVLCRVLFFAVCFLGVAHGKYIFAMCPDKKHTVKNLRTANLYFP